MFLKMPIRVSIFAVMLMLAGQLFAQATISTEILSVRDGLSNNHIVDIVQDQYGYMWIATRDGINRYNGYENSVFKNIPGDSTSLPHNGTHRILEDSEGTIWITTENGLARYNRNSNTFKTFRYSASNAERSNRVFHIYEDSRKMIWVSSMEGTFEFDRAKQEFTKYDVIKTDNSIVTYDNYSGSILENKAGKLYSLSRDYGLLQFDYDDAVFAQVDLKDNFNAFLQFKVYFDAAFDVDDNLWIGISDGLAKIDLAELTGYDITPFKKQANPINWSVNGVTGFFLDRNDNMWVATGNNGLFLYDRSKQKFGKLISTTATFFSRFYEDNSGLLWFGSSRGVHKYDFDRKPFEQYTLGNDIDENRTRNVYAFGKSFRFGNRLWLGTGQGVALFDKKNSVVSQKRQQFKGLSKLNEQGIMAVQESRAGKLWMGTVNDGLYAYDLRSGKLQHFQNERYNPSTLIDNRVLALAIDKNDDLWVGTQLGLQVLKHDETDFIHIPSLYNRRYDSALIGAIRDQRQTATPVSSIMNVGDDANLNKEFVVRTDTKVLVYATGEGLPAPNMVDYGWLASEQGDTLWSAAKFSESFHVGGDLKNRIKIGLLNLKAGRYTLRYISDDSHSYPSYNRVPPQDSAYWGVEMYSLDDETFHRLNKRLTASEDQTCLAGLNIQSLLLDSKNNIWAGTSDGFSKMDTTWLIENYLEHPGADHSISDSDIDDINGDLHGNIWLITSDGLIRYDPTTRTFSVLYEKDGLPSSNLSAIEVDHQGHLWVSSIKGIAKIELDEEGNKETIVCYDVKDGLQGYEFNDNASFKDETGKLYFAGQDGFNAFYPGNSNKTPPFLTIQDIKISNLSLTSLAEFQSSEVNTISELPLSHDQNDLSFEFAAIHYSRPDKNRLLYKLDGVDADWVVGDRRFASYTNLSPGDYTFNLRGSNGDGVWRDEIKKVNIHISAPWYANWVAYGIYACLFFGMLFAIRKFEISRQQKNTMMKETRLRAEAAEARALGVQKENERKSEELEEARQLQLSMLPRELPRLPNLDIAVYMQTATEVGGDYYDFHVALDGTLTVVIGDATGHGMKAGTMVTTAKTLFKSYAANPDILFSFGEFTRCIKEMNMGKMSMCLSMVKIKGNAMQMSTAGMPPSFIFRRDTRVVEEHLFKAMPLGTMEKFPYEIKDTTLGPGDTILLLSDGLPELKNQVGEMYGYKQIRNGFEDVAEQPAEEIISYLKNKGSSWVNGEDPDDDVTFVVIKVKS